MGKTRNFEQSLKAALAEEFGKAKGSQVFFGLCDVGDCRVAPEQFGRVVSFSDLPSLGKACLYEVITSFALQTGLADREEAVGFSARIISCLGKAKADSGAKSELHNCRFAFNANDGKTEMECIALLHMRKNGALQAAAPACHKGRDGRHSTPGIRR